MAKYQLIIRANQGYSSSQVRSISVEDLRYLLEDFEAEDEIILFDTNNPRGASYGNFTLDYEEVREEQ